MEFGDECISKLKMLMTLMKTEVDNTKEILTKAEGLNNMALTSEDIMKRNQKETVKMVTTILTNTTKGEKDIAKEKDRDSKTENILESIRKI
eukprot:CAMPEP_0116899458 /NCGR_PEP_ID=MMETSP0467-20121206/8021_1 /TAXON_ID=283647 /ORGANISM="Mesodinium pulex, Strain SPMC105" /LENGTH=91 /DNA_ID=CAMNT_0004572287 /DNA_START=1782 /DNA_END=2057 /DNA_ORIENTATION=-